MPLGDSTTDVMSLLAPDLMPKLTTRPPPEMAACQTLVLAFVDALKKQELQVTSLKEATQSHKRHIGTLKQELTSACHREYGQEVSVDSCIFIYYYFRNNAIYLAIRFDKVYVHSIVGSGIAT